MIKGIESIMISSPSAKSLAAFYAKTVGLKQTFEGVMGENMDIFGFEMKSGSDLWIQDNPRTKGKSKDSWRITFNLEVVKIENEVKRLKKAKVKQVTKLHHVEGYGYVSMFQDIDGNLFQLVQVRPD